MDSDVKEFWDKTFQDLEKTPLVAPQVVESRPSYETNMFTVNIRSLDNIRFQGMLVVPKSDTLIPHNDLVTRDRKVIIYIGGSGLNNAFKPRYQFWFSSWATFLMDPRGQGHSRMDTSVPDHLTRNIQNKDLFHYRGVYCDVKRAVDWLWNIGYRRIGMAGTCFGGGIAVPLAVLETRIVSIAADAPWPCDIQWACEHGAPNYWMLIEYLQKFPHLKERVWETLRYYDPIYFAPDVKCPVLLGFCNDDPKNYTHTMMSLWEKLDTTKSLLLYNMHQHGCSASFCKFQQHWFEMTL
jgi:cephalosporin-C deacetylase-like acetyl esterase